MTFVFFSLKQDEYDQQDFHVNTARALILTQKLKSLTDHSDLWLAFVNFVLSHTLKFLLDIFFFWLLTQILLWSTCYRCEERASSELLVIQPICENVSNYEPKIHFQILYKGPIWKGNKMKLPMTLFLPPYNWKR